MGLKKIIRMYERGNVSVCGLRGSGKDLLTANVIARRKKDYISNLDYGAEGCTWYPVDFEKLDCGKNTYDNFIKGNIKYYKWEYPYGTDVYLSDAGIYFPSQYCNELNKKYAYIPTYQALCRQVSRNNFHTNAQNLNRVWDKIREQSDQYIMCLRTFYIFGLVIQLVRIYDKYQSAVDRVKPAMVSVPMFSMSKEAKMQAEIYLDKFRNTYGSIESKILIYFNRSKYDTYYFEKLLESGEKPEDKNVNKEGEKNADSVGKLQQSDSVHN